MLDLSAPAFPDTRPPLTGPRREAAERAMRRMGWPVARAGGRQAATPQEWENGRSWGGTS